MAGTGFYKTNVTNSPLQAVHWSIDPLKRVRSRMNGKLLAIFMCTLAIAVSASLDTTSAAPSSRACDAFARDYARNASRQGHVVRRGLLGGLIGGVATGSAAGAAVGTGVGLVSGDRKRQRQAEKIYRAAYRDCMAGRVR
jgi:hypothetical protein